MAIQCTPTQPSISSLRTSRGGGAIRRRASDERRRSPREVVARFDAGHLRATAEPFCCGRRTLVGFDAPDRGVFRRRAPERAGRTRRGGDGGATGARVGAGVRGSERPRPAAVGSVAGAGGGQGGPDRSGAGDGVAGLGRTIRCTVPRRGGSSTATTRAIATCRCISSAANTCCAHGCARRTSTRPRAAFRS